MTSGQPLSPESLLLHVPNSKLCVATCNLNQWALDFDGNLDRIKESIRTAKSLGARYRVGPELEFCGYDCEDHFFEMDTFLHCEQSLAELLSGDWTDDLLCDFGCPIVHNSVRYNCRIWCLNRKILLIRPKISLADDGNYREKRYFSSWDGRNRSLSPHLLSDLLRTVTGQQTVPIGIAVVHTQECSLANEICEELWTPRAPHVDFFLSGVDIVSNGSGSHHELRKLQSRLALITSATQRCGGAYLYANHRGGQGSRLYFDGSSCIVQNGQLLAQASQFGLRDVEVVSAFVDLDTIASYRSANNSLQEQSAMSANSDGLPHVHTSSAVSSFPSVDVRYFSLRTVHLVSRDVEQLTPTAHAISARLPEVEEECARGPACWLWDYLRRANARGFLLPLSGGADSAAVAGIVHVMCRMVAEECVLHGNNVVRNDVRRLFASQDKTIERLVESCTSSSTSMTAQAEQLLRQESGGEDPQTTTAQLAERLCHQVLHTVYLGTSNSSFNTQSRAQRLSANIHSYHHSLFIDDIVAAVLSVFTTIGKKVPRYESQGGTMTEDLALQNIQARLRMVMSYLCAQLLPWVRGHSGFLLVLGSANVDEALRGYMTKYDCSSADLNPIGGMCKRDLNKMLRWIAHKYDVPVLEEIADAPPSAELRPIDVTAAAAATSQDSTQRDEDEMGMTYDELSVFGTLRKIHKCGPVKMFLKLLDLWKSLSPEEIATKVKRFFYFYSVNRHKMTTLTPAYHAEGYSPDDNRFDLRPFLYNTAWTRQFNTINAIVASKSSAIAADSSS